MAYTSPSATSSSSSPSPNPPGSVESYIGSFISLISKYEIRYEGVLYHLNITDSTIGLQNVRSFGTEGRRKDGPEIPPSDKVFEFILFRGSDIKDLQVKSSPTAQTDEQIEMDPAVIESRYTRVSLSSSMPATAAGKSFVESTQGQSTPALLTSGYPQLHKTMSLVGLTNPPHDALNAGPSFSTPMYSQRHNETLISDSLTPQNYIPFQMSPVMSSPLMMQNQIQGSRMQDSPVWGLTNLSDSVTAMPSTVSNSLPTYSTSRTPMHHYIPPDMSSYPSVMTSPPSNAAHFGGNQPITLSIPLSSQAASTAESRRAGGAISDPTAMHSNQPAFVVSSHTGSMPSPLATTLPPLLSPDQLVQSRLHVHSSTPTMYPDQDMGVLQPTLSTSMPLISTPVYQPPLLPLPTSVQQHKQWTTQFTQEFDFDAMNEKFKKDEVWGYLGKAKQVEVAEDGATDQSLGDKEVPGLVPDFYPKPAYKKDDFFDTISCNSLTQGRSGQARFSERMKLDTETFGRFYPRPNLSDSGGHGARRGYNYHGTHEWEKGYGYGGRGRGNMPF